MGFAAWFSGKNISDYEFLEFCSAQDGGGGNMVLKIMVDLLLNTFWVEPITKKVHYDGFNTS